MKKITFLTCLILSLATPAFATTQSVIPDFHAGDSLVFSAYDTDDNDFTWFAQLTSNPTPTFNIFSNTKFDGQTLAEHLSGYAVSSHGHSITDVTGLSSALDGKAGISHTHAITDIVDLADSLSAKVDIVVGKGLSANDYTTAEKSKLAGIATAATANSSDATLLARANHTGSQAISTVTGLQAALDGKQAALAGTTAQYVRGDGSLATYTAVQCYSGTTQKTGCFPVFKSATVASGVAVFHLTTDGTSGGTALFPNGVDQDSVQLSFNDSGASYQPGWAWSNSNKTLTVTLNKLGTANILTGILGQTAAPNGFVVKLTAFGN